MKSRQPMKDSQAIEEALGRKLLLGETIARNARKYPDKEALVYGKTRLTYKQLTGKTPEAPAIS